MRKNICIYAIVAFLLITTKVVIFAAGSDDSTAAAFPSEKAQQLNLEDPYAYTGENDYPGYNGWMPETGDVWDHLWGVKPQNSVNLGLWTLHLSPGAIRERNWDNQGLMVTYDMFFVGTFINSFWERAALAGVQRNFYQDQVTENTKLIVGYRLGAIYGYGGSARDYTPILPLAQLIARIQYRSVGLELQYTGIIVSGSFYFTF